MSEPRDGPGVVGATTPAMRRAALAVRRRVFIEEQGVPEDRELDGRDAEAVHFVALAPGAPREPPTVDGTPVVGTARLRPYEADAAKAERVAVLPESRGQGWGRRLMAALEARAREAGRSRVVLDAQEPVVAFYERLGYEARGEPFEDAGIPHRRMERSLE